MGEGGPIILLVEKAHDFVPIQENNEKVNFSRVFTSKNDDFTIYNETIFEYFPFLTILSKLYKDEKILILM